MAEPLAKTFDLLAKSQSAGAVDVLIAALNSKHLAIRDRAVAALLRTGNVRSQTEVLRRLDGLSPASRKLLDEQGSALSAALRRCLLQGDGELRANALTVAVAAGCCDQAAALLEILERRDEPFADDACRALRAMVNRVYEERDRAGARKPGDRTPRCTQQARQTLLAALDSACARFNGLSHVADIVENVLILGDAETAAVRRVLFQAPMPCRELATGLLMTSKHPGVMRLLMDFMSQCYPHPKAIEAFEERCDSDFVCFVLRSFSKPLSENQEKNWKQLVRLRWVSQGQLPLESIPPGLHESLSDMIQATRLDVAVKNRVQTWLLAHGSVQGRLTAGRALHALAPDAVRGILIGSLEAEEEDVQAWATSQLRAQGVPEAIRLLVEKVDSSLPAVREAARLELESFNLELMLNIFEHLEPAVGARAGALIRKIDPQCRQKLCDELQCSVRRRRIRAVQASQALGLSPDVRGTLLAMLADEDPIMRRTVAEVLASVPDDEQVIDGLTECLTDPSVRVREAAEHSLEQLLQRTGAGTQATTVAARFESETA